MTVSPYTGGQQNFSSFTKFTRFDEKNFKRRMKPVIKASEIGRADVLSALIDGGAGIDSSVLSLAQVHNHEKAVIFLEQALHAQAMYSLQNVLRDFTYFISVFRASAIGAAKAGNSSAIEALAMAGGDLNIVDK
jgi:ankyrin repeat protein